MALCVDIYLSVPWTALLTLPSAAALALVHIRSFSFARHFEHWFRSNDPPSIYTSMLDFAVSWLFDCSQTLCTGCNVLQLPWTAPTKRSTLFYKCPSRLSSSRAGLMTVDCGSHQRDSNLAELQHVYRTGN